MYLHLGQDVTINSKDIIGIFDLENTSVSKDTKDFLRQANHEYEVITVSYEMPKSYVLCENNGQKKIYISQISAATLKKRALIYENGSL